MAIGMRSIYGRTFPRPCHVCRDYGDRTRRWTQRANARESPPTFDQTKMNTVRKILLVPIYISVAVLAVCAYLGPRALSVDYPAPYSKKAVEWHAAALKSNDPEILRDHADKLWVALNDSDKTVGTFVKATRSGLIAASIASFALLVFSVAAFIQAKGKDRTIPSSKSSQGSTADG